MYQITGKTKLLGIIGDPVEHSLSPIMHNTVISELEMDYIYVPFTVTQKHLNSALIGLANIGVVGFNVTIPHKETILPLLFKATKVSQLIGAVNTVWYTDEGWYGTNTDVVGILASLKPLNYNWSNTKPIILGYGGAAKAAMVALAELGCTEIIIVGRNYDRLKNFRERWSASELFDCINIYRFSELPKILDKTQLLINATPIGMYPNINHSPIAKEILKQLPNTAIIYDLIYTPSSTILLQDAANLGLATINGSKMLVHQGAAALGLWLQKEVPTDLMYRSLMNYLQKN
ncbi:shikimate dehydrogenase [Candidatus Atelocyanobacterium thalassae]|uniref:Shikimate dehydrogenase (NADP(+)) n=1 Tax=cyanobacterium endosymbiont of Braarudosphaera bigelowii TaxID=1285375 RepID=A0ABM7U431_9CHRO|nr:shikimate dehydrogenase [Candidatus Atelocyanobacterium thalassa]BDA39401.1 shikimate dehydrogenase [cyanobacterium endosymbiont of Braarudosphaera bigelowii]